MLNFGDLSESEASWERSRVVVLSAPFGQSLTYRKGAEKGPRSIIEASQNLELFDLELKAEPSSVGIHTLSPPSERILSSSQSLNHWIYETTRTILNHGKFPVLLGGEHSVSLGSIRSAAEAFSGLSVLCLDAHADMRDEYQGNRLSHACVMRRCMEWAQPVLLGVRSLSTEEYAFLSHTGVFLLSSGEFLHEGQAIERVLQALSPRVYLSVDLDVLDPSEMPSVGTPEPGGLSWFDLLRIIRRVAESKEIVAADFVELSPIAENVAPDFLAAKLIYKLIGYVFLTGKSG
jgi:agmatinase